MKTDDYLLWNQKKLQILVALSVDDLTYMEVKKLLNFSHSESKYYLDNLVKSGYIESYKIKVKTKKRSKNETKDNTVYRITDEGKEMLARCIEFINNMIPDTKEQVLKLRND